MRKGINRCGKYLTAIIGKFSTAIYIILTTLQNNTES